MKKRICSALLAAAMLSSMLPAGALAADAAADELVWREQVRLPEISLSDNDALFAKYVEKLLYGNDSVALFRFAAGSRLSGNNKTIYDDLKAQIAQVASGSATSTVFTIDTTGMGITYDASSRSLSGVDTDLLLYTLLVDSPYEMYWFDKVDGGMVTGLSISAGTTTVSQLQFKFTVADGYAGSTDYTTDPGRASRAVTASQNARSVVAANQSKSDYEKLVAYKDYICDAVSYDNSAASVASTPYGDPWQLISVFDEDNSTNVVCEGYSKAFQYLCDLSTFTSDRITCYTMTGTMNGGTGAGAHMWNVITMDDGRHYLVDLTNSDEDSAGAYGGLFLAGAPGRTADGYTIHIPLYDLGNGYGVSPQNISYAYDAETRSVYPLADLLLHTAAYTPPKALTGIAVSVQPNKTSYAAGEKFDPTGMVVTATYDDTTTTAISDYTIDNADKALTVDDTSVTIRYGGETTTVAITVSATLANPTADLFTFTPPANLTYDGSAKTATVTYKGSDPAEVGAITVLYDGAAAVPTDAGPYTVTITTAGGSAYSATATPIEVGMFTIERQPTTITPSSSAITVVKGQSVPLRAGTTPAGLPLTYQSDSTGIATVDTNGTVTGAASGAARVTIAYAGDRNHLPASANVDVTVAELQFYIGAAPATAANAVTVKANPAYGDTWSSILQINSITAKVGSATGIGERYYLSVTPNDTPNAGQYTVNVLYSGTVAGMAYNDVVVCSVDITVAPQTVTPSISVTGGPFTYNGNAHTPAVSVSAGAVPLVKGRDYTVSYANNINAGAATVTVLPVAGSNYTWAAATQDFTIGQAVYTGAKAFDRQIPVGASQTMHIDLSGYLSLSGLTISKVAEAADADDIVSNPASAASALLTFTINDAADAGKQAVLTATVNSANYQPFDVTFTLTTVAKADAGLTIAGAPTGKVYGDAAFTLTANAAVSGANGVWSWRSGDPSVLTVSGTGERATVTIHKAGSTSILVAYTSDSSLGEASVTIDVAKRPVTVKPADLTAAAGDAAPTLALDYTGVVSGDSVTAQPTPVFRLADQNGRALTAAEAVKTAGTYTITWTNMAETAFTGDESYQVTRQATGTLTVTADTSNDSNASSGTLVTQSTVNTDGSRTTTVTNQQTGTVTETTRYTNGSTLVVETRKDGTETRTETRTDKVVIKTVQRTGADMTATVTLPRGVNTTTVTLSTTVTTGTVAVDTRTGKVVRLSIPTTDGMLVKLDGSASLRLEDRSPSFIDTRGHWAQNAIDFSAAHAMFNGTTTQTFSPDDTMTRAMLMAVLARFDGYDATGSAWREQSMNWATARGISDGTDPDGSITREQLATMLYRYAGSPAVSGSLSRFADRGETSGYAVDAMRWAVDTGLIDGVGGNRLNPGGDTTRAQVATILMRFCTNLTE